jgi:hypothetical protein
LTGYHVKSWFLTISEDGVVEGKEGEDQKDLAIIQPDLKVHSVGKANNEGSRSGSVTVRFVEQSLLEDPGTHIPTHSTSLVP